MEWLRCIYMLQEIQAIDNAMKKMKFGQGVSCVKIHSVNYLI